MDLVLLLGEVLSHWDERLKTHDSDGILLVLRELSEDWKDLLQNVLFFELGSKFTKF